MKVSLLAQNYHEKYCLWALGKSSETQSKCGAKRIENCRQQAEILANGESCRSSKGADMEIRTGGQSLDAK